MAEVSLRVERVSSTSSGLIEIGFSIMVGGEEWVVGQVARGVTATEVRDNALAVANSLVTTEKIRQKIAVGQLIPTALDLTI